MENSKLVPVTQFCVTHSIEIAFIESLQQYGLVEIITVEEQRFVEEDQLADLERFVRLHYDLDINIAGIEAIAHLLERVKQVQASNTALRNRLSLYEEPG
jgi:chaperone modulatory protein CbpM